jgi:hypothetical protein
VENVSALLAAQLGIEEQNGTADTEAEPEPMAATVVATPDEA